MMSIWHLLIAEEPFHRYNDTCYDYTPMDAENTAEGKMVKKTLRIPKHLIKDLEEAGKKHYRSFNGELIVAIEYYLSEWKNKH